MKKTVWRVLQMMDVTNLDQSWLTTQVLLLAWRSRVVNEYLVVEGQVEQLRKNVTLV